MLKYVSKVMIRQTLGWQMNLHLRIVPAALLAAARKPT